VIESFRAMNTDITLIAPLVAVAERRALVGQAKAIFDDAECRFSRFRPESEVSRLNASDGPTVVSAELFDALERARAYWELTDGWFDVTVGRALSAAGYDRSFAPGLLDRSCVTSLATPPCSSEQLMLDRTTRTVGLPHGAAVDCGGFIKGWTADSVAQTLGRPSVVDAGGDAVLRGAWPNASGWQVHVEDPWQAGRPLVSFRVADGAVATSGTNRRRWSNGAELAHHLIDPHTGRPSTSDLVQVTVVAPAAEMADVLAKTVLLRGERDGERFLNRFPSVAAVLVPRDGKIRIHGEVSQ
jgi:FAD:protein FMN transferase